MWIRIRPKHSDPTKKPGTGSGTWVVKPREPKWINFLRSPPIILPSSSQIDLNLSYTEYNISSPWNIPEPLSHYTSSRYWKKFFFPSPFSILYLVLFREFSPAEGWVRGDIIIILLLSGGHYLLMLLSILPAYRRVIADFWFRIIGYFGCTV